MTANPYESPMCPALVPVNRKWFPWTLFLACVYPVMLVASVHGTWLLAWVDLGHKPRVSIDDPTQIGVIVDVSYFLTGILLVGFPIGFLVGVAITLFERRRSWETRIFGCVFLVMIWIATIFILRYDPLRVVDWFMD